MTYGTEVGQPSQLHSKGTDTEMERWRERMRERERKIEHKKKRGEGVTKPEILAGMLCL